MSTKVWELAADDAHYASLTFARDEDCDIFLDIDRTAVVKSWTPPPVYHYLVDETSTSPRILPFSDFPGFGDPVFTPKSIAALKDLLEPHGKLYPLVCPDGGEFYFYNVTTILDVIDHERSEIEYFPPAEQRRIMFAKRYAFIEERLQGAVIFRLKDHPIVKCVTALFVERVKKAGLTGFDFKLLT